MFPLQVDPKWYENYWYSNRPRPRRRSFGGSLARFAMLVGLLAIGSPTSPIVWIMMLMNLILFSIFLFSDYFSVHDRYRYVGDAVFLLPLLCLLTF